MTQLKVTLDTRTNHLLHHAKPNAILAFNQELKQLGGIVNLTVGEPDFNTPDHIKRAAMHDIETDDSHYGPSNGTLALRTNASQFLNTRYGTQYTPNEIIATVGVTEAIYATFQTILEPGDEVLIPTPTFPLYAAAVTFVGGRVVTINISESDFKLTPEQLTAAIAAHPQAKAIVLTAPGNPTGVVYSQDELDALVAILKTTELFVIADEIYSELVFDQPHISLGKLLPEQTILFNGVSKSHAMTGYRIGIIAAPQALIDQLAVIHQLLVTAPTNAAVAAATEAFGPGANDMIDTGMKAEYKKRRDHLLQAIEEAGLTYAYPGGAFYLWFKAPVGDLQDWDLVRDIAQKAKVGLIPGIAFGEDGRGWLRASYATSYENIVAASTQLVAYFKH
ncbi:aminotransferase class I/II-fold pyridoxal phosphate-dependent enzyme [Lacticaseibacillus saniviri]